MKNLSLGAKLWWAVGCVITLLIINLVVVTSRSQRLIEQQEALSTAYVAKVGSVQTPRWEISTKTRLQPPAQTFQICRRRSTRWTCQPNRKR